MLTFDVVVTPAHPVHGVVMKTLNALLLFMLVIVLLSVVRDAVVVVVGLTNTNND